MLFDKDVNLGGADKIVAGQATERVGRVNDRARLVSYRHLGVMVFALDDQGDFIGKRHRFPVIFEDESSPDRCALVVERPVVVNQRAVKVEVVAR